jgi:hypothetical protein
MTTVLVRHSRSPPFCIPVGSSYLYSICYDLPFTIYEPDLVTRQPCFAFEQTVNYVLMYSSIVCTDGALAHSNPRGDSRT